MLSASQKNALELFFNEHQTHAFKTAYALLRQQDDALELVQDAMLKLTQNYAGKSAEDWKLLFYKILHNRIRDYFRKQNVMRFLDFFRADDPQSETVDEIDSGDHSPDQLLDQHQQLRHILNALNNLPLRQQQVFLMRAWQGFSIEETARALSISAGSVKTHYSRAQNFLRQHVESDPISTRH